MEGSHNALWVEYGWQSNGIRHIGGMEEKAINSVRAAGSRHGRLDGFRPAANPWAHTDTQVRMRRIAHGGFESIRGRTCEQSDEIFPVEAPAHLFVKVPCLRL